MDRRSDRLAAARPGQALLAPMAVIVGASYARFDAQPGPGFGAHLAAAIGALASGVGVNLLDAFWDAGGEEARLAPRDALTAALAAFVAAAACGTILGILSGPVAAGYGVLATLLAASRRVPAVGLDTLGWGLGELAAAAAWGPCAVLSGFATRAGTGSSGALLAGLPVGLAAAQALFARHFTQRDADARLGRVSPLVSLGEREARRGLVALPLLAAAGFVIAARAGEHGAWGAYAAVPMLVSAALAWRLPASADPEAVARWQRLAVACALVSSGLVAASLGVVSVG